jgi:hypothetical protein
MHSNALSRWQGTAHLRVPRAAMARRGFAEAVIQVRRTSTCGKVGWPKSEASKGPVPLHPLLAEFMFR